jgi:hypothetical protein
MEYSTDIISSQLLKEIGDSLRGKQFGSVEIFIENGQVTHITERVIKKYKHSPTEIKKVGFREKVVFPKSLVNKNR